ncbi:MAG: response regulator, partial [Lachnospiraceae bacterium]|nr:response regulator [Lachnospiraceae bacterium]
MTKILLVEDDVMIASGVKYALEIEGYEVIHAIDIKSAFDVIKDTYFDLAILDMQLP